MKGREEVLRILREMAREGEPTGDREPRERAGAGERPRGRRVGAAADRFIRRAGRSGPPSRRGFPAEAGRWMGIGLAVGAFLVGLSAALLVSREASG